MNVGQAAAAIMAGAVDAFGGLRAGCRVRRRVISVMDAQVISVSLITWGSRSWSRQCRRARMIHDSDLSTLRALGVPDTAMHLWHATVRRGLARKPRWDVARRGRW